jgi:hypothetical protein
MVAFSGPSLGLNMFTILSSNQVIISSEIKLSNMANLSKGKGDNSTIMGNNNKFCPDRTVNPNFHFFCPYDQNQTWA